MLSLLVQSKKTVDGLTTQATVVDFCSVGCSLWETQTLASDDLTWLTSLGLFQLANNSKMKPCKKQIIMPILEQAKESMRKNNQLDDTGRLLLLIKSYEIGHFWILDPSFPKCEKFHYDIHFFSIKNLLKFFLKC